MQWISRTHVLPADSPSFEMYTDYCFGCCIIVNQQRRFAHTPYQTTAALLLSCPQTFVRGTKYAPISGPECNKKDEVQLLLYGTAVTVQQYFEINPPYPSTICILHSDISSLPSSRQLPSARLIHMSCPVIDLTSYDECKPFTHQSHPGNIQPLPGFPSLGHSTGNL